MGRLAGTLWVGFCWLITVLEVMVAFGTYSRLNRTGAAASRYQVLALTFAVASVVALMAYTQLRRRTRFAWLLSVLGLFFAFLGLMALGECC